ncbi:thioredoxin-like protein [Pyronema omphalodes]|nr:thioredoxin-like protein [Pyronema omphalodes]
MSAKLTFYTNRYCPWASRAHIGLQELGLEFKEEFVDLTKPRTEEYLKINPRGLVPALQYNDTILIESGIITQFLADLPGKSKSILPAPTTPEACLFRARLSLFVETFISKVGSQLYQIMLNSKDEAEKETKIANALEAIKKDIVPMLEVKDAENPTGPFFGGSQEFTLAEVNCASFLIRIYKLGQEKHGLIPSSFVKGLEQIEVFNNWAQACIKRESVSSIFDEEANVARWREKIAAQKA